MLDGIKKARSNRNGLLFTRISNLVSRISPYGLTKLITPFVPSARV